MFIFGRFERIAQYVAQKIQGNENQKGFFHWKHSGLAIYEMNMCTLGQQRKSTSLPTFGKDKNFFGY